MKTIPNPFTWYEKPAWHWPAHDEKLQLVNNWVRDVDLAFNHIGSFNIAVQAGGACGVWAAYLATKFKKVITFEPVKSNYECLKENVEHLPNVTHFLCGLSDKRDTAYMNLDDVEKNNCGAYYASTTGQKTPMRPIDALNLKVCDLIALDVEGLEEKALKGAKNTIERCNPVIMLEEKQLPHLPRGEHRKARAWLESIGYKQVETIHRDVVFKR